MVWLSSKMLAQQCQGPGSHPAYSIKHSSSKLTTKRHRPPELQGGWGATAVLNTKPIYLCDRRAAQLAACACHPGTRPLVTEAGERDWF